MNMENTYKRPQAMTSEITKYCPGCMHGTITKITSQVLCELGIRDKTIAVLPIGCGTQGILYWNLDLIVCAHGRAPAVATGIKRTRPDVVAFTYQGDGDLAAIGFSEIMHAANRGENFTTIFVNNSIYGMTGGQMAPTTLLNQKSTTTPKGRCAETDGYPLKMCELITQLEAPVYVARFAVNTPANIKKAIVGIKRGFELQMAGKGFSFIEILSNCPTNWGMSSLDSLDFIQNHTMKQFPLGEFKTPKEEG